MEAPTEIEDFTYMCLRQAEQQEKIKTDLNFRIDFFCEGAIYRSGSVFWRAFMTNCFYSCSSTGAQWPSLRINERGTTWLKQKKNS
jgi:hypothetical protein